MLTRVLSILALIAATLGVAQNPAQAADKLKVAISQRGFWDSSFLEFAEKEEFLKAADLDVEFFYTEGGGQTLQIINSGSVDVAMSNGLLGTIGAYTKGAPIRVISAQMTGANELFWYVRADSKVRNLKEADGKSIAFSAPGSSSNLVLLSLLKQAGSKARPVGTGGLPGTLTQVMTGQIDIGWAAPPFALRERQENRIAIVARAREATELKNQTIRVNIANVESLKTKRAAITRLMQVYDKAIEWAYVNPKAIDYFAEFSKAPRDIAKQAVDEFFPKEALQIGEIRELDMTLRDALQYKFITSAMTPKDVEGMIDILHKPR
ncbi:MAG TPA: ABC transporter substrate-binding protein [Xanthobacteraceae bacterium]|jgi:NitT/TauT family transport system substrate-binding protein|nr:ABC transporter substrate-binding protein [Xanthobacteraceae bacterium]